jgi:hypothetical protein
VGTDFSFGLRNDTNERGRSHDELSVRWAARAPLLPHVLINGTLRFRIAGSRTRLVFDASYVPPGSTPIRIFAAVPAHGREPRQITGLRADANLSRAVTVSRKHHRYGILDHVLDFAVGAAAARLLPQPRDMRSGAQGKVLCPYRANAAQPGVGA